MAKKYTLQDSHPESPSAGNCSLRVLTSAVISRILKRSSTIDELLENFDADTRQQIDAVLDHQIRALQQHVERCW